MHPSDGSQSASLVKAVSIVGNGSGGNLTIHNGTIYTTYDGDSFMVLRLMIAKHQVHIFNSNVKGIIMET